MAINEFQKHEQTVQELQNRSFDPSFDVNAVEVLGYDDGGNALRRIAVDGDGKFEQSPGFATESTLTLISNELKTYAIQYAVNSGDSTITYVGKAVAGSSLASAVWQIKQITDTSGDLSIQFADGDSNFNNVWNNRESLSYS